MKLMGVTIFVSENLKSPSVWREWIEIIARLVNYNENEVSLRVEGVD